jgi:hypothetical protein
MLILCGSLVETVPGYAHVIDARSGAIRSLNRAVTKRFDGGGHDTWQLGIIGCVASFPAVHSIGLKGATSATALAVGAGIIQLAPKAAAANLPPDHDVPADVRNPLIGKEETN